MPLFPNLLVKHALSLLPFKKVASEAGVDGARLYFLGNKAERGCTGGILNKLYSIFSYKILTLL